MSGKPMTWADVVRIDIPASSPVPVENGHIYVKVYAKGDTPMDGPVYAVTHLSATPSGDAHDIGDVLTQITGTDFWEGCIPAPLGNFYVTACAKFLDADDPMTTHHVPDTSVQLRGEEDEEPRCSRRKATK